MADTDLDVVRKGYAAFIAGDLDTLGELFAEDATWVVPGNGPLSGAKQGRDAILAYFVELMTRTEGSLKVTLLAVAEGEDHVFALDRTAASRNGASLESTGVNLFRLKDGRVQSVQQYFENTAENDAFWA